MNWNSLLFFITFFFTACYLTAKETNSHEVAPPSFEAWYEFIYRDRDHLLIRQMAEQVQTWEEAEENAEIWDTTYSPLYQKTDTRKKKSYLTRLYLKYIDAKFEERWKKADEGTSMAKAMQTKEALNPHGDFHWNPDFKFSFKARLIEATATLVLKNPYVDTFVRVGPKEGFYFYVGKKLDEYKLRTDLSYTANEGSWMAAVDHQLSESLIGRISSEHSLKTEKSDEKVEVLYSQVF